MAFTEHTREFLAEERLAVARRCARQRPAARRRDGGGPIVHIPASDFTDNRVLRSSPMDLWDVYKETFDYLYLREPPAFWRCRCTATSAAGR